MLLQLIMLFLQLVSLLIITCDVPVFYVMKEKLLSVMVNNPPIFSIGTIASHLISMNTNNQVRNLDPGLGYGCVLIFFSLYRFLIWIDI
jgi:hypothetical protein